MILKQPLQMNNLTIHNRLVLPPMASKTSGDHGYVSDEMIAYYEDICRGGHIGLVIVEHAYIHIGGKASAGQMSVADDGAIEGLKRLVDTIHGCGSKIICQINHAGSGTKEEFTEGLTPIAPSAVGHPMRASEHPRAMTMEEIKALPKLFADAAIRAKKAGFDGVEIHACHGYLLSQFNSPLTNLRTDEYGGSLENRIRIIREVYGAVREAVGEDYFVALRYGGCDYMEGGSTIADCAEACKLIEAAGVDIIDLSGGLCNFTPKEADGTTRTGVLFEDMAKAVKAVVKVPVILTGGIRDAETAERLLSEGLCDLVGIGRSLLKDPNWPANQVYNEE